MEIKAIKGIYDSNTYVVVFSDACIIIDAGAPFDAVKHALGNYKPSAILLTHEHFDHIFHVADYLEHFPNCPIYAHPATISELRTSKLYNLFGSPLGAPSKPITKTDSLKVLSDNQILNIGPFSITTIFAPGHSDGSVVYLINNNLFTGDVLFRNSIGRMDLCINGEARMQQTLRNMQNLKFETSYHGHGSPCDFAHQQKNIARHLEND